MRTRAELVAELVRNPLPAQDVLEGLRGYGWDSDVELVLVSKVDVFRILALFRYGDLDALYVQAWANRIEGREDVGYEGGAEGVVKEAIFWLANPCLNWPIDAALCARIERLFAEPNGRNDRDL
jgi:hypothetical protein